MKENVFIRKNISKWKAMDTVVSNPSQSTPDALADIYLDLTSDLAFAQTNYPESNTTKYLNDLAFKLHNKIYRKERTKLKRFLQIWTRDVPKTMYESRRMLAFSFIAFALFSLFGVISQLNDIDYARNILGDSYVNMTIENIREGRPTDVYSQSSEVYSFVQITLNNLLVDLRTFVLGIFTSLGTLIALFYNGMMLGSFQTFFFQYGVGWESVLSIWQHGALEIPACIISGAAGITLGNGWLFPKTYSRAEAFKRAAKQGLKIMLGIIPVTIVAGFIEGFITRHTELPDAVRIATIVLEFAFILIYFVIFPMKYRKEVRNE